MKSIAKTSATPLLEVHAKENSKIEGATAEQKAKAVVVVYIPLALAVYALLLGPRLNTFGLHILPNVTLISGILFYPFFWVKRNGVTVFNHRYWSHRSFKANEVVQYLGGIAAGMAAQGDPVHWGSDHRKHHKVSDTAEDNPSPWHSSNMVFGFFQSYLWWMWTRRRDIDPKLVKDLLKDPVVYFFHKTALIWPLVGFVLPGIVGGLLMLLFESVWGGVVWDDVLYETLMSFIWGGVMTTVAAQQVIAFVNSFCHIFGRQLFSKATDHSGNVAVLNKVTGGEASHGSHHTFFWSACAGLFEGESDSTFDLILWMEKRGWVSDIRTPSRKQIKARLKQKFKRKLKKGELKIKASIVRLEEARKAKRKAA